MKRNSRAWHAPAVSRPVLLGGVMVLLALTSASVAAADAGPGPFGVTRTAEATARSARVGALFRADRSGDLAGNHSCTASVVHSPQGDLIVTAAHCVTSGGAGLVFVPGYRDGRAPYGVWRVGRVFVSDGWSDGQAEDSDIAFAVVDGPDGGRIEDVVGGNRIAFGTATGATGVTVTGYPNTSEVPLSCTNKPSAQSRTQQRIDCPGLTGGTSGSPWVNGDHRIVGVLGGYERGGATDDTSYSVTLGEEAAGLYQDAVDGS
ncbi:trypsin-like serine peptidase [Streptomyces sp. NPDC086787]|uniref:trypsin-like serine peptidase n=1 Tax=Streptomyces sp. NPDC086787 TaxID=3365759 RepID=UPI0037F50F9E